MSEKRISTLPRFLYLNTYAILLMFTGIGVGLIPLYRVSMWLLPAQLILFVICFRNSLKLFGSWKDKKRKYAVLMEYRKSFAENLKSGCRPVKTVVYMNGEKL